MFQFVDNYSTDISFLNAFKIGENTSEIFLRYSDVASNWAADYGATGWPDCGGIDIVEHRGDNQDFVQSAIHNRSSLGGTVHKGGRGIHNASSEFHIYTLEWNANKIIFSVDGIVHYTYNPENKDTENQPYDVP